LSIAALASIDVSTNKTQVVAFARTKEAAYNLSETIEKIGKYMKVKLHVLCGGTPDRKDIHALKSGAHIVVGTTGKMQSFLTRDIIKVSDVKLLLIDSAHEMSK
jgi:superfamily II DNA/RNA helicase